MINLSNITLGQYAPRDSWIHHLDPRTKLLVIMGVMLFIFFWNHLTTLLFFLSLLLLIYHFAKLSPLLALRNIRSFFWLFLFTFIIHVFYTEGDIIFQIPWVQWTITKQGIQLGLFYTIRIAILIILANLLTLTTSPMEFTDGLERILTPLKRFRFPAHEIAMMISIALRFIPILLEEVERIQKAQISRGARFEGNLIHRIQSIIPIIVPLFVSTFRRANDLALAMDARCYRGGDHRSSFQVLKFNRQDWVVMVGSGIFILPLSVWG
ncbi:energy-coupling factor transporter transmembrane component T family protein [bacterium]